jgi:SsrA-binding protein
MEKKEAVKIIVATNRKALRDYHVLETYEAGIALLGNEVKSLRAKTCSIDESFARMEKGELFVYSFHIQEFAKSSYFRPDTRRVRKLLLNKNELKRIGGLIARKGLTLIPLKVYFNPKGLAKLELAVAKGKNVVDRREDIKDKITRREVDREFKNFNQKS